MRRADARVVQNQGRRPGAEHLYVLRGCAMIGRYYRSYGRAGADSASTLAIRAFTTTGSSLVGVQPAVLDQALEVSSAARRVSFSPRRFQLDEFFMVRMATLSRRSGPGSRRCRLTASRQSAAQRRARARVADFGGPAACWTTGFAGPGRTGIRFLEPDDYPTRRGGISGPTSDEHLPLSRPLPSIPATLPVVSTAARTSRSGPATAADEVRTVKIPPALPAIIEVPGLATPHLRYSFAFLEESSA